MFTATHSSPGAGGTSSLPGVLLYLFVPALVQPRPTGIGGKRFFTKAKSQRVTAPIRSSSRAILGTLLGSSACGGRTSKRQKPNPVTEPEFGATAHSQIGAEAELIELRSWRDALLQTTQTAGAIFDMQKPGDKLLLAQATWQGGYSDRWWCLREANPRVTTLAPRALTSPSLCLAGLIGSRSGWSRQRRRDLPSLYCVLITHAWRAQVDVLRGSHRANLALEPTAFH